MIFASIGFIQVWRKIKDIYSEFDCEIYGNNLMMMEKYLELFKIKD